MSDLTDLTTVVSQLVTGYGATRDELTDYLTGTEDGGPKNDGYYPITVASGGVISAPCPRKLAILAGDFPEIVKSGSLLGTIDDRSYTTRAILFANLVPPAGKWAAVYADPDAKRNGFYIKSGDANAGSWLFAIPLAESEPYQVDRQNFTATASQKVFDLGRVFDPASLSVYSNGLLLPPTAYTAQGGTDTTVVLTTPATAGAAISVGTLQTGAATLALVQTYYRQVTRIQNVLDSISSEVFSQHIGRLTAPVFGQQLAGGSSFLFSDPVTADGIVGSVKIYAYVAGPFTLERWRVDGTNATRLQAITVNAPTANAVATFPGSMFDGLEFEAGDYVGFYADTTVGYRGDQNADGSGWRSVSGVHPVSGTISANNTGGRLEVAIDLNKRQISITSDGFEATKTASANLMGTGRVILGSKTPPINGTQGAPGSYIMATPIPYQTKLKSFEFYLGASSYVAVEVWERTGDTLNRIKLCPYGITNGEDSGGRKKQTAADFGDLTLNAGQYLGFSAPAGTFTYSPNLPADDAGWFQDGNNDGTVVAPINTQVTNSKLQVSFAFEGPTQVVSARNDPARMFFNTGLQFGNDPIPMIVVDGNSLSHGVVGGTSWVTQLSDALGQDIVNFGIPGQNTGQMSAKAAAKVDPLIAQANGRKPILFAQEMVNDLLTNGNPTDAVARMKTYCLARRAAGWKVGVFNLAAAAAQAGLAYTPAMRDTTNNLIDQQWTTFADFLVDLRVPELNDPTNTIYYPADKLHYTTAGGKVYYRQARIALRNWLMNQ